MLALILAAAAVTQPDNPSAKAALALGQPALAKRVDGDISAVAVNAFTTTRGWTIIRGPMRALTGMGEPKPGSASTHHLIRSDFDFICWVRDTKVIKISLMQIR